MANFEGIAASEALVGTSGDDIITGGGGGDRIDGGPGGDSLTGGSEADILLGEGGNDVLAGGGGSDYLDGGAGNDVVHGGDGDDTLISGSTGTDSLYGEAGNDYFSISRFWTARPSHVVASGGTGEDSFYVQIREGHTIAIDAGDGDDYVRFNELYNSAAVTLGTGRDFFDLGAFDYYATRGGRIVLADFAAGAAGDILFIDDQLERLTGWNAALNPFSSGHFRLVQSGADVVFSVSLAANGVWLQMVTFKNASVAAFTAQNFGGYAPDGSTVATAVTGSDVRETLTGGGGADVILALGGNDRVLGGAGHDDISGGDGNDYLNGEVGDDVIEGGAGNDQLLGGHGDDQLHGGAGNDSLNAGISGADQMFGEGGDDSLSLSRASSVPATAIVMSGGSGNDTITLGIANGSNVTIDAGEGHDRVTVTSLSGLVSLTLGAGQDVVDLGSYPSLGGGTIDLVDFAAGAGGDRIEMLSYFGRYLTGWDGASNPFLTGHARLLQDGPDVRLQIDRNGGANLFETLLTFQGLTASALTAFNLGGFAPDGSADAPLGLDGSADPDWFAGGEGGDRIDGLGGGDRLFGHAGADDLDGGEGDDRIDGGGGDDLIEGGEGLDQLTGGTGDDSLSGGAGNDVLTESGSGDDILSGGDGDDTIRIIRNAGTDQLVVDGGAGDDFLSVSTNPTTVVTADLGEGSDWVELRGTGTLTLTLGGGRDMVDLNSFSTGAIVAITDFVAGDAGDRLDFDRLFADGYYVTDGSANPFKSGFLRLVQSGSDVILQRDQDGTGTAYAFVNWLTLENVDLWTLTSANLDNYELPFTAGTAADDVFQGTALDDLFNGGGGNDVFRIGYGGSDIAIGGSGDDLFYVSIIETGVLHHSVEGAGGNDLLVLQGNRGYWTTLGIGGTDSLSRIDATGIEGLVFLSGFDTIHGAGGVEIDNYRIFLDDGIAAAGIEFLVDARGLTLYESLKFSTSETDAPLRILGGAGDDDLQAGAAGAHIEGNGGSDYISGSAGNDVLLGGAGKDLFHDYSSAGTSSDFISGGDDDDYISIFRTIAPGWGDIQANGDAGADTFDLHIEKAGITVLDGGDGNDLFKIYALAGDTTITLGAGTDRLDIYEPARIAGQGVVVTDYDPASETIGIILTPYLQGHTGYSNPFGTGRLRLVQDGADVLFQADRTAQGSFETLLRLQDLTLADFQNASIGGWMIFPVNGTDGDDEITGTIHADMIHAGAGNDLLLIQQGGVDKAIGGTGDDVFVLGAHLNDKEEIDGGEGQDTVILQGFVSTTLGLNSLIGIETLRMLPGDDIRFGASGTATYTYNVTTIDSNVAPGAILTVDMAQLRVGEHAVFNGGAESDGRFAMIGGRGNDGLTGGSQDDVIDGGEGDDFLAGGAGIDSLAGSAGADSLDGGAGADVMSGGQGNDHYTVDDSSDSVVEAAGEGVDKVATTLSVYALAANVEDLAGKSPSGQSLRGNALDNVVTALGGADTIRLQDGGTDRAAGGSGNDVIFFGATFDALDQADGSIGSDSVVLQGTYAGLTLSAASLTGIETLSLLSRTDTRYGGSGAAANNYNLTTVDSNVASLSTLIVNASGLAADESLTFDGSAETNGNFTIVSGGGADRLTGGSGKDSIDGGAGNDYLDGGAGADTMIGGSGSDIFIVDNLGDTLFDTGVGGVDEVRTALAIYQVNTTAIEVLRGTSDSGQALAGSGVAGITIIAGAGNDNLHDVGAATMRGNLGDDTYIVRSAATVVIENAGEGIDLVSTNLASYTLGANVENLTGTATTGQTLRGNGLDNVIRGGSGVDVIGLDLGGSDSAFGGAGDDIFYFGAAYTIADKLDGGDGKDFLVLHGDYSAGLTLAAASLTNVEALRLLSGGNLGPFGSWPNPAFSYRIVMPAGFIAAINHPFDVDGAALNAGETLYFDASADASGTYAVNGGAGADTLIGSRATDALSGGGGNDFIDGGQGADLMHGGLGDDIFIVDNALDQVQENAGQGQDEVRTGLAAYTLAAANVEVLRGLSSSGQKLTAGIAGLAIFGGSGNDTLDDGGFASTLNGGLGNDVYVVRSSGTTIVENAGSGDDEVRSFLAGFTLGANLEALAGMLATGQSLTGNERDNLISGGAGDDRLDGGGGADSMAGGAGDDLYLADSGDQLAESAGEGIDEVRTGSATFALGANFETLTATGYGAAPLLLRGNALDNVITTEVGGAVIFLHDGGSDVARGATNADTFYFGAAFGAGDRVDGGLGSDTVVLQGVYGELILTAGTMIGVQTLALLSAGDNAFGGATAGAFSYDITVAADFSSAIPSLLPFIDEEGELLIDAGGLGAGESLHFDGSAADPALTRLYVKSGAGADHLVGSAGADTLLGGAGDDLVEGGGGDDYLEDWGGGSNILRGGEGDDVLSLAASSWTTFAAEGGNGDDRAVIYASGVCAATLDMGAGEDRVEIIALMGGTARVTLGAGRDTLAVAREALARVASGLGTIVVADFETGDGHDRFEWPAGLAAVFDHWSDGANAFATGHARLVQDGADTLLQLSLAADGVFATLARFENTEAHAFTGWNLGGWSPFALVGGGGADALSGTASSDMLYGAAGNDFFYMQDGGEDLVFGGTGNDVIYFGNALSAADVADGGDGRDAVVLQGNVTIVLSDTNIVNVESISLQSGANTRYGDTANNFYDFDVTMADGNVLPGRQLIVNGQSLRAGEDFTFNGSAETDGRFLVYGGHGVDDLTGGAGVDVFFFEGQRWGPNDKVDGGAGRDSLVISAGSGVTHIEFAADALTNIESISVNNLFATDPSQKPSYELVLHNGNVAPGGTLIVNGSSIATAAQFVNIDGSGVHDGNLILFSGAGSDVLIGGDGGDILFAAAGADDLTGGAGADTFRYDAAADSAAGAADHILDFQSGTDKIDLSRIDADANAGGNQAFTWIGSNAFTNVAGQLRAFQSGGDWIVQGDTNGDGIADLVINVTTQGAVPLVQGDFLP